VPGGVGREDIASSVRLFHLADVVEVIHRTNGVDAAVEVARARRGSHFDPAVVDAFCATASDVLDASADEPNWHDLIAADPTLQHRLTDPELDAALEVVADFTDLRSTWRAGHSRGVAGLAAMPPRSRAFQPPRSPQLGGRACCTMSAFTAYRPQSSTSQAP